MIEIIQGDAVTTLNGMESDQFDMVLADPPFNMGKDYGPDINDNMPEDTYAAWLQDIYKSCSRVARVDAVLYAFCGSDQVPLVRSIIEDAGWDYVQMLIWYGRNGFGRKKVTRRIWATLYEPIIYASKGNGRPSAEKMPWYHAVIVTPRPQSNFKAGRWHVCEKPVRLYSLILQAHNGVQDVLDPTVGSGSSMVACAELGINGVGVELNAEYVELSRGRVKAARAGLQFAAAHRGQRGLF